MKTTTSISIVLMVICAIILVYTIYVRAAPDGFVNSRLILEETISPAAMEGHIQLYAKSDNVLYFQDGSGIEHAVGGQLPSFKSYSFRSKDPGFGTHYIGGFYQAPDGDANLTDASPVITYGEANHPYAAHAFIVSAGNGIADGSDLVLTVSGTSITDAGVRTESDSQVIVPDATNSALNSYHETPKKWLGTIIFTLTSTGGTVFSYDFNYGYCKYEDWGNRDFTITDFECTGSPNMSDAGFEIEVMHHKAIGWIYDATDFISGTPALWKMTEIHATESDLDSGEPFAFKLAGQSQFIDGGDSEGTIIRITTTLNNAVFYMNAHLGVNL